MVSPTSQTVVVFGGTGFIGGHLVRRLVERQYRVRVVTRHPVEVGGPDANPGYVRADIADADRVAAAVDGASAVVHLATGGGERWSDFERDFVHGTRTVAQACQQQGVKRLVYTSSTAALYLGKRGLVDEWAGVDRKAHRRNMYSRGKIAAEAELRQLHARDGLPIVILRPGIVVGPSGRLDHHGLGAWTSDRYCVGWGRGDSPLPFVLVGDVARALHAAVETPGIEGMAFNLAGDVRLTAAQFVRLVAEHSRRNVRFQGRSLIVWQALELGTWLMKLAARRAEADYLSRRELESSSFRTQLDCSAARSLLGWEPNASLDEFVRQAILANLRPIPPGDPRRPIASAGA